MINQYVLGRGELEIDTASIPDHDNCLAVIIEPIHPPGPVGEFTGTPSGLQPVRDGGLILIVENVAGAVVLRDKLNDIITELSSAGE